MPRLWEETVDAHRHAVRAAIIEATVELVSEHGLRAVTMAQVADAAGVGRATLYKYFPDVDAILVEWHRRRVAHHLERLRATATPPRALEKALEAYALMRQRHGDFGVAALVHHGPAFDAARDSLQGFFAELIATAASEGAVRGDIPARELAGFCVNALDGAAALPSAAAARRLVRATLSGMAP